MRNYGQCPACRVRFGPGRLPQGVPLTCPACGAELRVCPSSLWAGGLVSAACSIALSAALGFKDIRLWAVAFALWFPMFVASGVVRAFFRPLRYLRVPDRFESRVSLFRKPPP
jgi:hypothetical protein